MLSTHLFANPEINLQGNANNIIKGAVITNSTNNTNFGTVNLPNSLSNIFIIQNTGFGTLSVTSVSITGANASDFSLIGGPAFPFTVAASSSQTITVQFTPSAAGTRSAIVTINNNDLDEAAYDFVIDGNGNVIATGLANAKRPNYSLSLFPNPAQNEIQFNIPWYLTNKDLQIKVYDAEGKLVCEKFNSDITKTGNVNRSVNVSELNNGLYYFILISNGQKVATKKLVISK